MTKDTPDQDDEIQPTPVQAAAPAPVAPAIAKPDPSAADLSSELVKTLPKAPGEHITCRRITGNHYRCNWWMPQNTNEYDNPAMSGLTVTTHRVSKSQFLRVTKIGGHLDIKQRPAPADASQS